MLPSAATASAAAADAADAAVQPEPDAGYGILLAVYPDGEFGVQTAPLPARDDPEAERYDSLESALHGLVARYRSSEAARRRHDEDGVRSRPDEGDYVGRPDEGDYVGRPDEGDYVGRLDEEDDETDRQYEAGFAAVRDRQGRRGAYA